MEKKERYLFASFSRTGRIAPREIALATFYNIRSLFRKENVVCIMAIYIPTVAIRSRCILNYR